MLQKDVKDTLFLAEDNKILGHFGYNKTLSLLRHHHWRNKSADVSDYCHGCHIFQLIKDGRKNPLGVTQPLELPIRSWGSISMDFITLLTMKTSGHDCITTYVDRFSKRVRLIPSNCSDSATDLADAFFKGIFPLHGLPDSIIYDRDAKFTS